MWRNIAVIYPKFDVSRYIINEQNAEIKRPIVDFPKISRIDKDWITVKARLKENTKEAVVELNEKGYSKNRSSFLVKNLMYETFITKIPSNENVVVLSEDQLSFSLKDIDLAVKAIEKMNSVREQMETIDWKRHPRFEHFLGNADGEIYSLFSRTIVNGYVDHQGYTAHKLFTMSDPKRYNYRHHRFIWECFNVLIMNGDDVDHIKGVKSGDALCNLQRLSREKHNAKTKQDSTTFRQKVSEAGEKSFYRFHKDVNDNETDVEVFRGIKKTAQLSDMPSRSTITKHILNNTSDSNGWYWKYEETMPMEGEIWKGVTTPGLEGLEVSSCGRVRSERIMTTFGNSHAGHHNEKIVHHNRKLVFVKTEVCQAFNGPCPNAKREVSLKDKERGNVPNNVYWSTTQSRGRELGVKIHGFFPKDNKDLTFGEWFGTYDNDSHAAKEINLASKTMMDKGEKGDQTKCDCSGIRKVRICEASVCGKDSRGRKRTFVPVTDATEEDGPDNKKYIRVKPDVRRGSDKRCTTK